MRVKNLFLAVMALIAIQSTVWAAEVNFKDMVDGTVLEAMIGNSTGPYKFKVRLFKDDFGDVELEKIEVYSPAGKNVQSIKFPDYGQTPCPECKLMEFKDLNFDGFRDLLLLVEWGSSGEMYEPWIFNPKSARFEHSSLRGFLKNPTIDAEKKLVIETSRVGCCEGTVTHYEVTGNKFRAIKKMKYIPSKASE